MSKRNELNDAGNSDHKPTQVVNAPEGLCDGSLQFPIPSAGYCTIPAGGLCTYMVPRVCASYCTECIFHTAWLQMLASYSLGAQFKNSNSFQQWNVIFSLVRVFCLLVG